MARPFTRPWLSPFNLQLVNEANHPAVIQPFNNNKLYFMQYYNYKSSKSFNAYMCMHTFSQLFFLQIWDRLQTMCMVRLKFHVRKLAYRQHNLICIYSRLKLYWKALCLFLFSIHIHISVNAIDNVCNYCSREIKNYKKIFY